jgi:hypothetical protein
VLGDIVYGGIEGSNDGFGLLARWNTSDLSFIDYKKTDQEGMPWVAIEPLTKKIYSAKWNEKDQLTVFNNDFTFHGFFFFFFFKC